MHPQYKDFVFNLAVVEDAAKEIVDARINLGEQPENGSAWFHYISAPKDYEISLVGPDPATDELLRFELEAEDFYVLLGRIAVSA